MEIIKSDPVVIRSKVDVKKKYYEYREILRRDFWFSCAYCTITEIEAGGIGFHIDHYYPKKKYRELINAYKNLMWSCQKCNRYKSDYDPDETDKKNERVIIRPDEEDPRNHYDIKNYRVIGKTSKGEFNIEWMNLNRLNLRRLRKIRERFYNSKEYVKNGVKELLNLRIDIYKPEKRPILIKIRNKVNDQDKRVTKSFDKLIGDFARSPMIDNGNYRENYLRNRKKYLKDIKAIIPM